MNRSREEESDTHAHKNISREGEKHGNLIYIKMSIMYANTLHNGSIEHQKKRRGDE